VLKRETFWQKLLGLLGNTTRKPTVKISKTVKMNIVTNTKGERHVYHSLEELPPELKGTVASALAQARQGKTTLTTKTFKVRDASGNEHTYSSLEEMPPEFRAIVEKAEKDSTSSQTGEV
jgi:hypothetical protein